MQLQGVPSPILLPPSRPNYNWIFWVPFFLHTNAPCCCTDHYLVIISFPRTLWRRNRHHRRFRERSHVASKPLLPWMRNLQKLVIGGLLNFCHKLHSETQDGIPWLFKAEFDRCNDWFVLEVQLFLPWFCRKTVLYGSSFCAHYSPCRLFWSSLRVALIQWLIMTWIPRWRLPTAIVPLHFILYVLSWSLRQISSWTTYRCFTVVKVSWRRVLQMELSCALVTQSG